MNAPPSAPRSSRLQAVLNVFSNWGGFVLAAAINFFLSPFVVHQLGTTEYGAWVLLVSLVGYMGLLDLGVRSAVTKYVATHHAGADHRRASQVASASLAMFLLLGLLAIATSVVLAVVAVGLFNIPEELIGTARIVFVIGGLNVAVSLASGVPGGIVAGRQRLDIMNAINVGGAVLRAIAVVLALRAGGGLIALAVIQLGLTAVTGAAKLGASRRVYPELVLRLRDWSREHLREVASFGLAAWLLHMSGSLVYYSDSAVIGAFMPVGFVTFFAIAASLIDYTRDLTSGISQTVAPMAGALDGSGQHLTLQRLALDGSRFSTLAIAPILAVFVLRGREFIDLWMGPEYGELSSAVLVVLSISTWLVAGCQVCMVTLMGVNKHRALVPAFIVEALANVAISMLLIGRYGVVGVAWGTTVPRLAICGLFVPIYSKRVLGYSLRSYWAATVIRPALAVVPFAVLTYLMREAWPASRLWVFFGQVGLLLPVALVGIWLAGLSRAERAAAAGFLRERFRRLRPGLGFGD